MQIKTRPMGELMTNCYIVSTGGRDFIIDPGVGALEWIKKEANNPAAVINTHGHFDHVWSNDAVKKYFDIPLYVPRDDAFMLEKDPFGMGTPPSTPDYRIDPDEKVVISGQEFVFLHFPGHTPGCSVIECGDNWFSGDFIFKHSVGRYDFPLSDAALMKESVQKVLACTGEKTIYPGHGPQTTLGEEKPVLQMILSQM